MSLTSRVLLALGVGMALGLVLSRADDAIARPIVAAVEPIGTLFINAIRMTVVPLVVSSLVVGVASSSNATAIARVGSRGLVVFLSLLVLSGIVGAAIAVPVLAHVPADPMTTARLAGGGAALVASASAMQTPGEWVVALVPSNPIRAATDGAMLPLIVFSLVLGVALAAIEVDRREHALRIFRAIAASMLVIVRWLLVGAPLGVFALALALVARLGLSAVGALATYIVLVVVVATVFITFVLYPAGALGGGVSLRDFARAAAPAQAVALSSRSSMAALPALIETAETRLRLPAEITGFFLPLASATFRVAAAFGLTTGAVFIGRLYGVSLSSTQVLTIVATSIATSFSIPGVPGGMMIALVPVLASVGLPADGVGILLGIDTIPDIAHTVTNVTGQLAAAMIVSRRETSRPLTDM